MDPSGLLPRADLLAVAVALDLLLGDPVYRWHPVRLMGASLACFEARLRAAGAGGRLGGVLLFLALAATWAGGASLLLPGLGRLHPLAATGFHLFALYSLLALGDLLRHGRRVDRAAGAGDLGAARRAVSRLVGRDTGHLDAAGCRRAAIESLGENLVDAFVSPIFWYVVAGLPGIVLFKVVSTMDSMVGYRTGRYRRFGWCGARTDDLMNFVPARLTWLLIAGAALAVPRCSGRKALRAGWRQHRAVPGPNAGWSQAALAGALSCRLGGAIRRQGRLASDTWMGERTDAPAGSARDYRRAVRMVGASAALAFGAAWAAGLALFP